MKFDKIFIILISAILIITAIARTLKNTYEKKIVGKLGVFSSLLVSIVGGLTLSILVSIYTDNPKWHMLAGSIGAWSGEKSLDLITDFLQDKFNIKK